MTMTKDSTVVVLITGLTSEWAEKISRATADRAMLLRTEETGRALEILRSVPVAMIVTSLEPLRTQSLLNYQRMTQAAPGAVTVCLASLSVREQVRTEELLVPDFWLDDSAPLGAIAETIGGALEKARLMAADASPERPPATAGLPGTSPVESNLTNSAPGGTSALRACS